MARFFDHALREQRHWLDPELQKAVHGAQVIDGTNVAKYVFDNVGFREFDLLTDVPNLAPPFEKFWVECRAPKDYATGEGGKRASWDGSRWPTEWATLFLAREILNEEDRYGVPGGRAPNARWVLQALLFMRDWDTGKILPQFTWYLPVLLNGRQPTSEDERERSVHVTFTTPEGWEPPKAEEGKSLYTINGDDPKLKLRDLVAIEGGSKPLQDEIKPEDKTGRYPTTHGFFMVMATNPKVRKMSKAELFNYTTEAESFYLHFLIPCVLTVSFMHCKNVTLETQVPPLKAVKKAQKEHGEPLCSYHVLNIHPMHRVLEHEGHVKEQGLARALHIVRGHFADYNEHPLFGKYAGTFWVPQHLRGSFGEGVADKEYKVQKPKGTFEQAKEAAKREHVIDILREA